MYCLIAEGRIASSPSERIVSNAVYCAVDVTYILSDASYLMAAQTRAEGGMSKLYCYALSADRLM